MTSRYTTTAAAVVTSAILSLGSTPALAQDTSRSWDTITWDDLFQEGSVYTSFNSVAEVRAAVEAERTQLSAFLPQLDEDFIENNLQFAEYPVSDNYQGETCHAITIAAGYESDIAYHIYNGRHDLELMSTRLFGVSEVEAELDNGVLVPVNALRQNPLNDPYEADLSLAQNRAAQTIGRANGPRVPIDPIYYIGCEASTSGLFAIAADLNRTSVERHIERLDAFLDAYERYNPAPAAP